jgi:hypothetical protein
MKELWEIDKLKGKGVDIIMSRGKIMEGLH